MWETFQVMVRPEWLPAVVRALEKMQDRNLYGTETPYWANKRYEVLIIPANAVESFLSALLD